MEQSANKADTVLAIVSGTIPVPSKGVMAYSLQTESLLNNLTTRQVDRAVGWKTKLNASCGNVMGIFSISRVNFLLKLS
jgi:hypothetical protein